MPPRQSVSVHQWLEASNRVASAKTIINAGECHQLNERCGDRVLIVSSPGVDDVADHLRREVSLAAHKAISSKAKNVQSIHRARTMDFDTISNAFYEVCEIGDISSVIRNACHVLG